MFGFSHQNSRFGQFHGKISWDMLGLILLPTSIFLGMRRTSENHISVFDILKHSKSTGTFGPSTGAGYPTHSQIAIRHSFPQVVRLSNVHRSWISLLWLRLGVQNCSHVFDWDGLVSKITIPMRYTRYTRPGKHTNNSGKIHDFIAG